MHNEKRTVWWKEALIGGLIGIQYGFVQVAIGHPFDTIKTKMQAQQEFKSKTFLQSMNTVYKIDGISGFYKGGTPIILGSSFFRSAQFMSFEAVHSRFDKRNLKGKPYEKFFTYVIPNLYGLEIRTIAAGLASGICRTLAECPFEYVKIRKQVKADFSLLNAYHGVLPLMLKNSLMVSIGFSMIDILRRNTNAWKSNTGTFLASGFATIFCHVLIWPIEVFRNYYMSRNKDQMENYRGVLRNNIKEQGYMKALFRGAVPGLISTFLRNGFAILILQKVQMLVTHLGLRN
jgi:solute carrier family 25 carnitine/acylcarnitine transporter 20/29